MCQICGTYNFRLSSGVEIIQSQNLPPVNAVLVCKDSCLPCHIASLRALQLLVEGLEGLSQKRTDRMRQAA